jgi:HlyD family secretion protein
LTGADGKPKALNVRVGVTDGSFTELLVGPDSPNAAELVEGAEVIVGTKTAGTGGGKGPGGPGNGPRPPF